MSGSTIGGVVGAFVGFWVGGPTGAQVGFAIGSAVGGYVDPEKVQGPRLTDAAQQTSQDGIPITWGYGRYPTKGNLIWIQPGPPTEHRKTERQGKGGPKVTTFTYTRSFCIGIARGILREDGLWDPITGILIVKENGKIVYDARTDAELAALGMTASEISESRAASAAFSAKVRFHLGGEAQLPDPTIEAWEGVGNTPAHRGLVNMVGIDFDVTDMRGAINQYEFVVAVEGTLGVPTVAAEFAARSNDASNGFSLGTGYDWPGPYLPPAASGANRLAYFNGYLIAYGGSGGYYSTDRGDSWQPLPTLVESFSQAARIGASSLWVAKNTLTYVTNDGLTWTSSAIPGYYGPLTCIGGHSGLIIAGDGGGRIHYSIDQGDNFSGAIDVGLGVLGISAVSRSDNEDQPVVVVGTLNGNMAYSTDGVTWTPVASTPFTVGINCIIYAGSKYVAIGDDGKIAVSANASAWTVTQTGYVGQDMVYSGGLYVFAGSLGAGSPAILTSQDAVTWTPASDSFPGDYVETIAAISCGGTPIPDAPGWYIEADGGLCGPSDAPIITTGIVLGQVVADLLRRSGLSSDQYDVSQLTDLLDGYRIASEGGIDSYLQPLMVGYFFDVADWDGVVHCVKRGGNSLLTLTMDDLAERSGDALEWERIQEAELLRKVTVGYIDPEASYNATAQIYERRISTIQAKGESSIGIPVVTSATAAAQMAEKRTNVAWAETDKARISLPVKFTRITATDVVTLIDHDSVPHRIRMMGKDEDPNVLMFEAQKDRQSAYTGSVVGRTPMPPTPPVSALIGPTLMMVMNIPILSESHDELGFYVAARGWFPSWDGASIDLSTDAGATFSTVGEITESSVIGYTTTALVAWDSSEYPSVQTVDVWLPFAPSSIDVTGLLRYGNRAAIQLDSGDWAILQYQTVVANGDDNYTLSGLIRGRYNTTPGAAASGANFVLIDSTVQFIQAERWMLGESLTVRAVSYGTDPDAASTETFLFDDAKSQTEWTPHYIEAERDVSDNITTSCILRGRLGTETTPFQSKYFAGVRFTYSDGIDSFSYDVTAATIGTSATAEHEYTAAQQTTDFGGSPSVLTVTVAGLNVITGAGPASTGITV